MADTPPDNIVQLELPGVPLPDTMGQIMLLSREYERLLEEALNKETELKAIEERAKSISTQMLPDLMTGLGLTEITLTSGRKIAVVQDTFVNLTKEKRAEAYAWLRAGNMGGIIKSELIVAAEHEASLNVPFEKDERIHPSTLKAYVKEQMETNPDFPKELFGVYQSTRAIIKEGS